MPLELIIIAVTALLAGLLLMAMMLAGRGAGSSSRMADGTALPQRRPNETGVAGPAPIGADVTLRVVWWLTIAIVLLGVGISGSFSADQSPIFAMGAGAVLAVVVFHETISVGRRGRTVRIAELMAAIALIAGLLVLTEYAGSPFTMLFALVAVAAALAYGPRAGLVAAGLATAAFVIVLLLDPNLPNYGPEDVLRLSVGLVATWLLAFVAVAYSSHQRRAMQNVIELWRTDPLTGLFNRSQLFLTLEQEVSRTRRSDRGFCVLMIDVDGLKTINDQEGHLRGDQVLRALGGVIAGSIRNVDSAYRYGGDEFVVLLPETDIVGAFFVAEKIRAGAEEMGLAFGDGDPVTSVSIGLVSHPEDGMGAEQLIAAADRAMYEAKKLGKNQISGNPRPRPPLLARRSVPEVDPRTEPPAQPAPSPTAPASELPVEPVGPVASAPIAAAVAPSNGAPIKEDRATAVEIGPSVASMPPPPAEIDDGEADPQVVRRQIATASQSFDPDHQIRRAMDAFLSPGAGERERDRATTPDH